MSPEELRAALIRAEAQLAAHQDLAQALTSTLELREVLERVLQQVSALLRPRNWSLLLLDEASGRLTFEIAVGEGAEALKALTLAPGEGIAGQVFQTGLPLRVDDVARAPGFAPRFDQASAFRTRSILAAPLLARGRVLGVIELINGPLDRTYGDEDLATLSTIADYAAIALENARNYARVQELTLTDEHTGCYNARHLRAQLESEVLRARRFHHPVSLVFFDLDRFKAVNDTHGHLVGSAVLREVGELLLASRRQVDSAFRFGGDEFALLLVETSADGAQVTAGRLHASIREHAFQAERGLALRLTASVGVATFPDHCDSAEGLLRAADFAMYAAKARGRDTVCLATPAQGAPGALGALGTER